MHYFGQELKEVLDEMLDLVNIRVSLEKNHFDFVAQHEVEHCGSETWGSLIHQVLVSPIKAGVVYECIVLGMLCGSQYHSTTDHYLALVLVVGGHELSMDKVGNLRAWSKVFLK